MTLHISHNDLDGIGCAIIVKACIPSVETVYINNNELEPLLNEVSGDYDTIIITDLAPSQKTVERLLGECEIMIIDHHVSSINLKEYSFVSHDINKCATLLTYEKFISDGYDVKRYENFVDCVNDYDLWLLKREDSLQMNMLLTLTGIAKFESRFYNTPYEGFTADEKLIIDIEEKRRTSYVEKSAASASYYTDNAGLTAAVIFSEMYSSELGNYVIAEGRADYVLLINAQRRQVSVRSRKEVDISKLAMANGGGGHKNAAGFPAGTDFNISELLKSWGVI